MKKKILNREPKKILIVKPSSLGDIVHSLAFLSTIHDHFPQSTIDWVVARGFEGLLEHHPIVHRLWIIRKDQWKDIRNLPATAREMRKLFLTLRNEQYDLVVDLQGLLRSGLITHATKAPVRIGFKEAREGSRLFYTHTVTGGRDIHAVDRYLLIAAALGCEITNVAFPLPLVKETRGIETLKQELGNYAVVVPGARKPANRWPAERYGALASLLPFRTVVLGSTADAALAETVVGASGNKALSLAGRTDLAGLVHIIRGSQLMVCNDTGPMHIAAALHVPVVALFGPANSKRTGPYGQLDRVINPNLPCAPCYKKECKRPVCMEAISVEEVERAVKKVMSSSSNSRSGGL
ncbi:MAG TPA: lipopolysaccharide heptosyltransferase I [Dissulfurispiraceae bacterium]|nr:lipopolysaccharide heptosyltransferase I [Dissulfurispiraceae bacterium]